MNLSLSVVEGAIVMSKYYWGRRSRLDWGKLKSVELRIDSSDLAVAMFS